MQRQPSWHTVPLSLQHSMMPASMSMRHSIWAWFLTRCPMSAGHANVDDIVSCTVQGVLVEPGPRAFQHLVINRPTAVQARVPTSPSTTSLYCSASVAEPHNPLRHDISAVLMPSR